MRTGRHMLLRLDRGTEPGRLGQPPPEAVAAMETASAVLVSDYGRGLTGLASLRRTLTRSATRVPLVWDPHPKGSTPVPGAHLVCPNRAEAAGFVAVHGVGVTGPAGDDIGEIAAEATLLRGAWHVGAVEGQERGGQRGTARPLDRRGLGEHRDRRIRTEPVHRAVDIPVQQDVADHDDRPGHGPPSHPLMNGSSPGAGGGGAG